MREHEAWADLLHRLGGVLTDVVPPEAQIHLLTAQRELLTALVIIYEHRAGALKPTPPPAARRRPPEPPGPRTRRIPVE
jgi:hypothetical protein